MFCRLAETTCPLHDYYSENCKLFLLRFITEVMQKDQLNLILLILTIFLSDFIALLPSLCLSEEKTVRNT